jgi:hypothetical protein
MAYKPIQNIPSKRTQESTPRRVVDLQRAERRSSLKRMIITGGLILLTIAALKGPEIYRSLTDSPYRRGGTPSSGAGTSMSFSTYNPDLDFSDGRTTLDWEPIM